MEGVSRGLGSCSPFLAPASPSRRGHCPAPVPCPGVWLHFRSIRSEAVCFSVSLRLWGADACSEGRLRGTQVGCVRWEELLGNHSSSPCRCLRLNLLWLPLQPLHGSFPEEANKTRGARGQFIEILTRGGGPGAGGARREGAGASVGMVPGMGWEQLGGHCQGSGTQARASLLRSRLLTRKSRGKKNEKKKSENKQT